MSKIILDKWGSQKSSSQQSRFTADTVSNEVCMFKSSDLEQTDGSLFTCAQMQLSCEPQSLQEEQETQRLQQVRSCGCSVSLVSSYVTSLKHVCLWPQIQQLEDHLEKSKEELNQLKSDLQENVELVSFLLVGL